MAFATFPYKSATGLSITQKRAQPIYHPLMIHMLSTYGCNNSRHVIQQSSDLHLVLRVLAEPFGFWIESKFVIPNRTIIHEAFSFKNI